jgi:hypothetical protein
VIYRDCDIHWRFAKSPTADVSAQPVQRRRGKVAAGPDRAAAWFVVVDGLAFGTDGL